MSQARNGCHQRERSIRPATIVATFCSLILVMCPNVFADILAKIDLEVDAVESGRRRPLSVVDSIEMTELVDPDWRISGISTNKFKFSSDGHYFVVVTRNGNVRTAQNEYELLVYDTAMVREFVNKEKGNSVHISPPSGRSLVRLSSSTNDDAIQQVRWLPGSQTIVFLGKPHGEQAQVFSVDIGSKKVRKLTDHPRDVVSFEISTASGDVLYAATTENYSDGRGKSSFVVGMKTLVELRDIEAEKPLPSDTKLQYYLMRAGKNGNTRTIGEDFLLRPAMVQTWLSPKGRWAIAVLPIGGNATDQNWAEKYQPFADNVFLRSSLDSFDEFTMVSADQLSQFVLLDMESRSAEPIFQVPTGFMVAGYTVGAQWMPHEESVILANTFLPLDNVSNEEGKRRRVAPAIIEYNIRTRQIIPISDLSLSERFSGMTLDADRVLTVSRLSVQYTGNNSVLTLPDRHYRKHKSQWIEVTQAADVEPAKPFVLSIWQDIDSSPEAVARDESTGHEKIVTDLNPQLNELKFGKTESIQWTDSSGLAWQGALVYPPDYVREDRYPIVIQTHGYNPDQFLINGPAPGPFAAQALANEGIIVLQLPDRGEGRGTPEELDVHRSGVEAVIDKLDSEAIIDPTRVGIIGFSRTGLYVQNLITFSDHHFAAATIADSATLDLTTYIGMYGYGAPGMGWVENMTGAVPWGRGLTSWVSANPALHTDRIQTPLRLEQFHDLIMQYWETYVILRRQHKPVEFLVIPNGTHQLVKPLERFASQQGNVDWFDFWLNGSERHEPYPGTPETVESLAEQYERWRQFREVQGASVQAAEEARRRDKDEAIQREQYEHWLEAGSGDAPAIDKTMTEQ